MSKTIHIFEINSFETVRMQSFMLKKKITLGPKLAYLGIFGLKFEKAIVIFEISTLEFV